VARGVSKPADEDFWSRLAALVSAAPLVVDRPKGSAHPKLPEMIYPLDYGYLRGLRSGDGQGVDVYVGSLRRRAITGILCTVDRGKRDVEVKILLGCTRSEQRRLLALHNRGSHRALLVPAAGVRRGRRLPSSRTS
jgi:inorganic pyrophosphatase